MYTYVKMLTLFKTEELNQFNVWEQLKHIFRRQV